METIDLEYTCPLPTPRLVRPDELADLRAQLAEAEADRNSWKLRAIEFDLRVDNLESRVAKATSVILSVIARAEAAEAKLAAVPVAEIKQLYIATITPSDPERYKNYRRVGKWLFPDSEVQP